MKIDGTQARKVLSSSGKVLALAMITALLGIGMIYLYHDFFNSPTQTAERHVRENEAEITDLIAQAARQDPTAQETLKRMPPQKMSIRCIPPENDRQARRAIGRTSRICNLSLYGAASHLQANYLVFMKYRDYLPWEIVLKEVEPTIQDAYLSTSSLEVDTPNGALRVGRKTDGPGPQALRLTDRMTEPPDPHLPIRELKERRHPENPGE